MKVFTKKANRNFLVRLHRECILDILESIGNSRALSLAISIRHSEFPYTVDDCLLKVSPYSYLDYEPQSYYYAAQAVALVSKDGTLSYSGDLKAETMEKFLRIEKELNDFTFGSNSETCSLASMSHNVTSHAVIHTAKQICANILGPFSHDIFNLSSVKEVTKGSTVGFGLAESTVADKFNQPVFIRPAVAYYAGPLLTSMGINTMRLTVPPSVCIVPEEGVPLSQYYDSYQFSDAPKKYNALRQLGKGHFWMMYLQRTVSLQIVKRLQRKCGIDIPDGQSVHRAVLRLFPNAFCTIDLSDASDRLLHSLVKAILPPDWYNIVNKLSTRYMTFRDGTSIRMNKFAPQGNGLTFEIQTLIYYCLITSMQTNRNKKVCCFVYGDDIIVPESDYSDAVDVLSNHGLVVNLDKSFSADIPFKESCGFDFFSGSSVRPTFVKGFGETIGNSALQLIYFVKLHNLAFLLNCKRATKRITESLIRVNEVPVGSELLGIYAQDPKVVVKNQCLYYETYHVFNSDPFVDPNILLEDKPDMLLAYALFGFPGKLAPKGVNSYKTKRVSIYDTSSSLIGDLSSFLEVRTGWVECLGRQLQLNLW